VNVGIIRKIVFFTPHVLIQESGSPVELMPQLIGEFQRLVTLSAVCTDQASADAVRRVYGHHLIGGIVSIEQQKEDDQLRKLLQRGILDTDSTLLIDRHPLRCLRAVDLGIHSGIFVDAPRLYRDLGAWRIVPLERSLADITAKLTRRKTPYIR
jgi:hypothetical protein